MCGICGVVAANGSADPERVARMSATLVHRGPDSFGEYCDGTAALAARRLSIIDLETGDQPIANEDGTLHVVQNGEIYNYRELRWELERAGHHFRTHGDTEVLLHLYEQHGDGFAERLRGMFAVAIWDAARRRLVLARDRFGIKPLYYREAGGEVAFASELRALARGEIDVGALEACVAWNSIHAPLLLPALAEAFDEPFADSSALPTYLVSQLAAEDVKVALSGEGGDELFGGYHTYAADLLAERIGGLAKLARPFVERLPTSAARASFDYRAKRFVRAAHLPPLERHHGWKEIFSPATRAELTGRPSSFDPVDLLRARYQATAGADELARLQDVDLGVYLVDDLLLKTDRASMAHSLEVRVPFLDPVVAELALALPTALNVRGLAKKRLLRRAVAPLLPAVVVRGAKRGFSIPAAAWLRGELVPFARETLAAETLQRQGFFRPEPVHRLLDAHVEGREDLSRQLWGLLAFTLWYERHVEGTPSDVRMPELLAER